jgi:hypothetical protein
MAILFSSTFAKTDENFIENQGGSDSKWIYTEFSLNIHFDPAHSVIVHWNSSVL